MKKDNIRKMSMLKKYPSCPTIVVAFFQVCLKASELLLSSILNQEKISPYYYKTNLSFF